MMSHIIPKFVVELIKDGGTGIVRSALDPNVAGQDALREPLLCSECETRISKWERQAAPFVKECNSWLGDPLIYGAWFAPFILSVAWRVLVSELKVGDEEELHPRAASAIRAVEPTWRAAILDDDATVVVGRLHAFVLSSEAAPSLGLRSELVPYWHRYLDTTLDATIVSTADAATPSTAVFAAVYAKLANLVTFAWIKMPNERAWQGTRVRRRGRLNDGNITLPDWVLRFMIDRASEVDERVSEGLSARQRSRISERVIASQAQGRELRAIKALDRDVEMFGPYNVFRRRGSQP